MYLLSLGSGQDIPNPSPAQVDVAVRSLIGGPDAFVVLSATEDGNTYIQTAGGPNEGFILEYQNGALEEHYECTTANLGLEQVVAAFRAYLLGDASWRANHTWRKMHIA